MKRLIYILMFSLIGSSCQSQTNNDKNKLVGGPCEGCEAIFEFGDRELHSVDTLPRFHETTPQLKIVGTIFKKDGRTPAENVILYIYHTNRNGVYETKGGETGWARRHGIYRGWIKTDKSGNYSFYTFRPASYPNRNVPEHIHMTVKEPDKNEYYIDAILFMDDPYLSDSEKQKLNNRAGSGVVELKTENGILTAKRNIILGLNIPNYD